MLSDSLFFVEAAHLRRLAEEVAAVRACTTTEEAVRLASTMRCTFVPGIDPDDAATEDGPYDWSETSEASDGDWPPALAQLTLTVFPRDDVDAWAALRTRVGAHVEHTVLNGDLLLIPVDREEELLRVLGELGVQAIHDPEIAAVFEDVESSAKGPFDR